MVNPPHALSRVSHAAALAICFAGGCTPLVGSTPTDVPTDVPTDAASDVASDVVDAPTDGGCLPDTGQPPGTRDLNWQGGAFRAPHLTLRVLGARFDGQSRLYVFGFCGTAAGVGGMAVVRHRADGNRDLTFGNGGSLCIVPDPPGPTARAIFDGAVDAQGRMYLVGRIGVLGDTQAMVMRLDESGHLDPAFNRGQPVAFRPRLPPGLTPHGEFTASGVVVGADGVYVAGTDNGVYGFVAHLGVDGAVDEVFARSEGAIDASVAGWNGIAREENALLVAGSRLADQAMVVRKLSALGASERTFGADGRAVALAHQFATPRELAALADGSVVVVGSSQDADINLSRATAVRFTAAGALDDAFGDGGVYVSRRFLNPLYAFAMLAPQCDGRVVMGVTSRAGAETRGGAERVDLRGRLDPTFGESGLIYGDENDHGAVAVRIDRATRWIYLVTASASTTGYSIDRFSP